MDKDEQIAQEQWAIEAATQKLLDIGSYYGWFERGTLGEIDPIGKEEMIMATYDIIISFLAHAPEEAISALAKERAANYPDRATHR